MTARAIWVAPGLPGIWASPDLSWKPGSVNKALPVYVWRWRAKLPERHGEHLVVLVRGSMNSCLIEFLSDGYRVITSRNALRRAHPR